MTTPTKSLTSRALEGFSWTYLSLIFQAVLQLGTLAVLARMLGPREFGILSLALIFTNFVERVGFLGIGPALVQKPSLTEMEIRGAFSFSVLIGAVMMWGFYALAPVLADLMGDAMLGPVLQYLSVLCLVESACQILEHLLQRDLKFKSMLLSGNISYAIGNGIISISLAFLGFGVWSLVYGTIATRFLRLLFFFYLQPVRFVLRIPFREIMPLLISGIGFAWSRLFSFLAVSGDNFIVGKILGSAALGLYGRAYQLMTLPSNYFGQVLEKVLFPAMAKKQQELDHLARVFLWAIQLSALLGIPCSIFMYVAAPEMVLVLFGKTWLEVIPVLKILSLGVFFRLAYKNSDTLIRSLGAVYRHAFRQGAYAAIVIAGSIFGSRYGIEGVAVAVLIAVAVNYLVLSEMGLRLLKLSWSRFLMAHMAAVWIGIWSILVLPLFFEIFRQNEVAPLITLILGVVLQSLVYLISLRTCPKPFRASVILWIVERFKLEQKGWLLARLARAIM